MNYFVVPKIKESLRKIIELFRSSLVMFLDVPEEFKPFILAQSRIGVGSDPGRVIVWVESGMV